MKKWLSLFLSAILLVACSSPAVNTSISPTLTATLLPPTETPIPTATSTPTETPDPNMPEAPAGVTVQKDAQGYFYTDKEGVTYRNITITDSLGQERFREWFSNHVTGGNLLDGGTPLLDKSQYMDAGMPMYFYDQTGVLLPYISHVPNPDETGLSLSGAVYNGLHDIRFSKLSLLEMSQTYQNGSLIVPFTTPDGKTYIWRPGPTIGVEFYGISWEDADPATHPEFFETPEDKQFGNALYRWTVFTKSDGTLVILAAVQDSTVLNDYERLEWFLNPMGTVIEQDPLPTKEAMSKGWIFDYYPSPYVGAAIKRTSRPYFVFQTSP